MSVSINRDKLILTLPYPPTANNLFINAGRRRVKSDEYKAWIALAEGVLMSQIPTLRRAGIKTRFEGEFHYTLTAIRPDRRRRDIDNLNKATLDFLKSSGVIEDDCLTKTLFNQWSDDAPRAADVTVTLESAS